MLSQCNKSKVSAYGKQSEAVLRKSLFWTSIPCSSTALHCWRAPSSLKFSWVLQTPPPSSKLAAGAHQMSPFMPTTSDLAPIVYEPMDVSSISAPSRIQQRLLSALNGALSLARMQGTFRSIFTLASLPGAASQPGLCKRKEGKINKHMLQRDCSTAAFTRQCWGLTNKKHYYLFSK